LRRPGGTAGKTSLPTPINAMTRQGGGKAQERPEHRGRLPGAAGAGLENAHDGAEDPPRCLCGCPSTGTVQNPFPCKPS